MYIYHYWWFLDEGLWAVIYQLTVCIGCDNTLMMSVDIKSISIININGVGYRFVVD